jgi:hypothetical protein
VCGSSSGSAVSLILFAAITFIPSSYHRPESLTSGSKSSDRLLVFHPMQPLKN